MKKLIQKPKNDIFIHPTDAIPQTLDGDKNYLLSLGKRLADVANRKSSLLRLNPIKKIYEIALKRTVDPLGKTSSEIINDFITGKNKSFYAQDRKNGSNEIDTYLYNEPYNEEFKGDISVGPSYNKYIKKYYPNKNIKTYNTYFGDTLYIDSRDKDIIDLYVNTGNIMSGSRGKPMGVSSLLVYTELDRPYDSGGMLMTFRKTPNGVVADIADIYKFNPEEFNKKYKGPKSLLKNIGLSVLNKIGTPFIVRQNNIPVVIKDLYPEYKTKAQKLMADFLGLWGNYYNLEDIKNMTDDQIYEAFNAEKTSGDDIIKYLLDNNLVRINKDN